MRCLVVAFLTVLLAGCATGAKMDAMVPTMGVMPVAGKQPGAWAVYVGEVTGRKETNALWTSQIDNEALADAL